MEERNILDVFIIGAGPIGLACGIEARKAGLSYLIADKGCLVNSIFSYPMNMTFFSTSDRLEIGDIPFVSHLYKPNRNEALEYYRRVAMHWNLNLRLYTEVLDIAEDKGTYIIGTSSGLFRTRTVILATGFYDIPHRMGVEGEDMPKVHHYYKEAHPYFGQKVAVIGAANSAVDVALETFRKGADVTMIVREDKISDRVKYWVKPDIENRISEGSVRAYFNSKVLRIRPHHLDIQTQDGTTSIENDFVLAMTGYEPNFSLLLKAGVKIQNTPSQTPVYDPETMETNRPGIYLAGVVCGGLDTHKWFIENSRLHAPVIIRSIVSRQNRL